MDGNKRGVLQLSPRHCILVANNQFVVRQFVMLAASLAVKVPSTTRICVLRVCLALSSTSLRHHTFVINVAKLWLNGSIVPKAVNRLRERPPLHLQWRHQILYQGGAERQSLILSQVSRPR